jgi:predicted transcriptional regulator
LPPDDRAERLRGGCARQPDFHGSAPINLVDNPSWFRYRAVISSMANKAKPGRFTEAEVELMQILWESGPSTVQDVVKRLFPGRPLAYTTAQTVLNVLHRKGSVRRKLRDRAYCYEAVLSRFDAASTALRDLVHGLFGGEPRRDVACAEGR